MSEPTQPAAGGQTAVPLACPTCGSTALSLDYFGVTSIRMEDGIPVAVTIGGVLGGLPDQVFCSGCGQDAVPASELDNGLLNAFNEAAVAGLPDRVVSDLEDGFERYNRN